jgi:hypothetical protein
MLEILNEPIPLWLVFFLSFTLLASPPLLRWTARRETCFRAWSNSNYAGLL